MAKTTQADQASEQEEKPRKVLGSIDKRANGTYRLIFSFGRDAVRNTYRTVRVSTFSTDTVAATARAVLNTALNEGDEHAGIEAGVEAFVYKCEQNGWTWSGDLPGKNADVVTVLDLCRGFLDFRLDHGGYGAEGPMAERSFYDKNALLDRYLVKPKEAAKPDPKEAAKSDPNVGLLAEFAQADATKLPRQEVVAAARLLSRRASPRVAREFLNVLRPALQYAIDELHLIEANPALRIGKSIIGGNASGKVKPLNAWNMDGTLKERPEKVLVDDERAQVLGWLKEYDPMWYVYFTICLELGVRLGAVAGLRLSDLDRLDAANPSIITKGGVTKGKGGVGKRGKGKNGGTGEVVVAGGLISKAAARLLKEYVASDEWKKRAKKGGDYGKEDALAFRTSTGNLVFSNNWGDPFTKALDATLGSKERKKRELSANSCRHTFVTVAKEAGLSAADIADRIGNSEDMVNKVYFHKTNRDAEKKMAALNISGLE